MGNITHSFLLTLFAGLFTILGYFVIYIKNVKKTIGFCLSFASGSMVMISIINLLPTSLYYLDNFYLLFRLLIIILFIIIGIFLTKYINSYLVKNEKNIFKRIGILSLIIIVLHNIPEGIVTFVSSEQNLYLGIPLAIATAFHNIPEGISIAMPLYCANKKKRVIFLMVLLAGLSELVGALIGYFFFLNINVEILGIIIAVIIGIMLEVSFIDFLPNSLILNNRAFLGFLIGAILIYCLNYFI